MENPCKIILFGDSITKGYAPHFEKIIKEEYSEKTIEIINAGVPGETSQDGLQRLAQIIDEKPQVVVIGFGMNDWRKEINKKAYQKNIIKMIDELENHGVRVILMTLNPDYQGIFKGTSRETKIYSDIIRDIAYEKKVKIADINALWRRKLKPVQLGLRDNIHPNRLGYKIICESLMHIVPRQNTTVLWQYNTREAKCNYRCPYCYYIGLHQPKDMTFGTMEEWHEGFKNSFGNQHLILYLAFGEPSLGKAFYDIVEMVGSEPNWELRMTSNVSQPFERLIKSKIVKEGRMHINASFHPLAVKRDDFLKQVLFLRENGIETPIVYVTYPKFLETRFEDDMSVFMEHNFVVHVRRYQGTYKGKKYPYSFTDEQRQLIAKYSDSGSIKYMLNQQHHKNDLVYSGLHFFICDSVGNMGYDSGVFTPYSKHRCVFGNVHQDNFRPLLEPGTYPGWREGTVDGVSNLIEAGYHELEGNNVLSFARQGGVYHAEDGTAHYKHLHTDFNDSRIRAKYNFPPRNLKDWMAILTYHPITKYPRYAKEYGEYRMLRWVSEDKPSYQKIKAIKKLLTREE